MNGDTATQWKSTTDLRHILEWGGDGTKLVLQQRWQRTVVSDSVMSQEEEWREIPLWKLNARVGEWERP